MDLNYNNISVCKYSRQIKTGANVEADVIVPDTCPDIYRVLSVKAVADVTERTVRKDKVIISGNVKFNILYSGEGDISSVSSIEHISAFNHQEELGGADESFDIFGNCFVSKTNFEVKNSRKLSVGAMLDFDMFSHHIGKADVLCDSDELKGIPVKNNSYEGDCIISCKNFEFDVSDRFNFATNAAECVIHDMNVRLDISDIKAVNNKAVIKALANIELLYSSNGEIAVYNTEASFTEVADIENITSDSRLVSRFDVADISYTPQSSDSGIDIDAQFKIKGYICAFEHVSFDAVSDIYSPDYSYEKLCENICITKLSDTFKTQDTIKDTVDLSDRNSSVSKIYHMNFCNHQNDAVIADGMLKLSGSLESSIIYADEDNTLCRVFKSTPYEFEFPCNDSCDDRYVISDVSCINSGYIMGNPSEIQIRAVMRAQANIVSLQNHEIVTGFNLDSKSPISKDAQPSIVVFYPDASSDIWEIAKKYNTTCEEIASVNSLEPGMHLSSEKPILIPKRLI